MIQNRQILKFFPQPVFKYQYKNFQEINKDLTKYIYDLRDADKDGLERSNVHGWHSKNFNLKNSDSIQNKFLISLKEYIFDVFENYGWNINPKQIVCTEMWAIINSKNSFNVTHTHPNSYLSAAYYVKAPKNCGKFIVESPNIAKRHSSPPITNRNELNLVLNGLDINEGDLLLFPAYLPHKVAKNESDEDRIVISFNIRLSIKS